MNTSETRETRSIGKVSIVATPIGNLQDMTPRSIQTLQQADIIYCEDTRTFRRLATEFDIRTQVRSYHEHNERHRVVEIEKELNNNRWVALVSDAGTPLISDPGYHLVNLAHSLGCDLEVIPGPCAAIAALSASGFEPHRFIFEGFLPVKKQKRRTLLEQSIANGITTIFYESPHRVLSTVELIREINPTLEVCIARELTKLHEEILRGSATDIYEILAARDKIKGEIVLLLRAAQRSAVTARDQESQESLEG